MRNMEDNFFDEVEQFLCELEHYFQDADEITPSLWRIYNQCINICAVTRQKAKESLPHDNFSKRQKTKK